MIHRMRPRTPSAIQCDRFDSVFVSLHGTFLPVTLSRRLDLENYIINCVSRQSRVHFNACDTGLCAFFFPSLNQTRLHTNPAESIHMHWTRFAVWIESNSGGSYSLTQTDAIHRCAWQFARAYEMKKIKKKTKTNVKSTWHRVECALLIKDGGIGIIR